MNSWIDTYLTHFNLLTLSLLNDRIIDPWESIPVPESFGRDPGVCAHFLCFLV